MPPVGFEPTISAGERPRAYALDRAGTGTGTCNTCLLQFIITYNKRPNVCAVQSTVPPLPHTRFHELYLSFPSVQQFIQLKPSELYT